MQRFSELFEGMFRRACSHRALTARGRASHSRSRLFFRCPCRKDDAEHARSSKPSVNVKLDVELPQEPGKLACTLYFMSDSYMGCDQEYKLDLKIKCARSGKFPNKQLIERPENIRNTS